MEHYTMNEMEKRLSETIEDVHHCLGISYPPPQKTYLSILAALRDAMAYVDRVKTGCATGRHVGKCVCGKIIKT